jgi:hypothetical protein
MPYSLWKDINNEESVTFICRVFLYPKDGYNKFLQNTGTNPPNYTVLVTSHKTVTFKLSDSKKFVVLMYTVIDTTE